jgi:hypothetical protein
MNSAIELRRQIAASGVPVEFTQGSYRLRVMPGVGRIRDISYSIWETENNAQWEPILTGWIRDEQVIVATWRHPGSPDNVESMLQFILAGKRHVIDSITHLHDLADTAHGRLVAAAS